MCVDGGDGRDFGTSGLHTMFLIVYHHNRHALVVFSGPFGSGDGKGLAVFRLAYFVPPVESCRSLDMCDNRPACGRFRL